MNVLFSSTATIDCCGDAFYNNSVRATLPRYHRLGKHITCLAFSRKIDVSKQERIEDTDVDFVFLNKINSIRSLLVERRRNNSIIEEEVKKADLCVVHVPSFIGDKVTRLARKYGKPYVTVVVGCAWDAYWNYSFKGKFIAPFRYYSLREVQKNTSYSIYVTSQFLQERYPTHGKSIACSNVNIRTGEESVLQRRLERLSFMESPLKMATIAAVDVRYKGQEDVIKAMQKLKEIGYIIEYHLIGLGDPSFLQSLAQQCGVQSQVFFHGAIPHNEVLSMLDEMDVYIQPSKQEGLPRAVIEAMSRGCLCMGARTAGIPELLDKEYVFRRGNVGDIVSILQNITPDDFDKQAIRNFEEAKNYDSELLNKRRNEFLDSFFKSTL